MSDFRRDPDDDRLGSLAQSARSKQLRSARNLLFFVGGWLLFLLVIEWVLFNAEVGKLRGQIVNQELLDRFYKIMYVLTGGYLILGITYIVFGVKVKKHPVPITVAALVLFLGLQMVFVAIVVSEFPPEAQGKALSSGIILKIIVIVGLAKSIQAAIAYEAERKKASAYDDDQRRDEDDFDDDRDDRGHREERDERDDRRSPRSQRNDRDDW